MSSAPPPPGSVPPSGTPSHGPPGSAPTGSEPSGAPHRPPLRRRRDGKLLAGVLAGVADHLGLDVVVARILFVVLTLMTQGAFLLAYILGWIFIPEESDAEASAPRPPRREDFGGRDPLFWVGIGILIVGALWLLDGPFPGAGPFRLGADRSVLVPLVLIAFGVALWRASDRQTSPTYRQPPYPYRGMPPSETAMSNDDASQSDTVRLDAPAERTTGATGAATWGTSPPGTPPPAYGSDGRDWTPPPVPPSRGVLTRVTLGITVLTIGVLWLLDVADVVTLGPGRVVSAALLVIGAGLLVGSVIGRGRGLIAAGFVLLPVVLVLQVVQPLPVDVFSADGQAFGDNYQSPADASALDESYELGAGELRLDLTEIDFTEDREVTVLVGFGEARVLVPDDVTVEVVGAVGAGSLHVLGRTNDGVSIERTVLDEVPGSEATLTIHVNVGFGEIRVDRATTSENPQSAPFDLELEYS